MTSLPSASLFIAREGRAAARVLRVLVLLGLGIASTLILVLAVAPVYLAPSTGNWITLALVLLVPTGLLWLAHRRRISAWWRIGAGYLLLAPVLAYLAIDDSTLRHPVTLDEIAPAFPGAEKSFDVLMRYGKNHPLGRDFKAPGRIFRPGTPSFVGDPTKQQEWRIWLVARRAEIEADWADLAPVRAWWTELNAFDRIGDLTPARFDAEITAFSPLRSYSQHAIAIAGLQALDGHGDDAIATVLPVLEVSRKLEPSSRMLVRFMIARVMQRMALETAAFILDTTAVSPAARARLLAAVTGGSGGEAGARRLMAVEYAFILGSFVDMPMGNLAPVFVNEWSHKDLRPYLPRRPLNVLSPFVFNPHRTFNLLGDLTEQLQAIFTYYVKIPLNFDVTETDNLTW